MNRLDILCSYLDKCETFADVGCDHGYCTLYMLKNGLCGQAYISDISEKCLSKAKTLLRDFIAEGKVVSECCDGLGKIPYDCGQVLIAGMGGEEIIRILENSFVPERFVFQPMKNARQLREFLLSRGAEITYDGVFRCGDKFYFVIKGGRVGYKSVYSEAELEFGKDLKSADTKAYIENELVKKRSYSERKMSAEHRAELTAQIAFIKRVLENET